jgi:hypothetical protein
MDESFTRDLALLTFCAASKSPTSEGIRPEPSYALKGLVNGDVGAVVSLSARAPETTP